MKKINWLVRVRNPVWWVHIAFALLAPVVAYYGINLQSLTSWGVLGQIAAEAVRNPYVIGCALVSAWNAVYDPTSKGLFDCPRVMEQQVPRG